MTYNPNVQRRKLIRLQGYDYSQQGLYFLTLCTNDRIPLFGEIQNWEMVLNEFGRVADQCWQMIPQHFPGVALHEHVIMPNHVHGIIEITEKNDIAVPHVGVENFQPLQIRDEKRNQYQKVIPRSVGSIVRGFKIGVTKWMRQNTDIHEVWQRNYYEHIIRNQGEYERISAYIYNNPAQWQEDKFYVAKTP